MTHLSFLTHRYFIFFCTVCLFVLGIFCRFSALGQPPVYYFDEVYHLPTATLIARDDPRAFEWWHPELTNEFGPSTYIDWLHPPLAKLFQAGSLLIFGDHPWSWRLPSALAGTLLMFAVFFLTRALWPDRPLAYLLATLLIAIDGLVIAQSRIAMNDIFVTFFMTLAVLFYYLHLRSLTTRKFLLPLALATGLAIACKWSGIFLFLFFGLWETGRLFITKKTNFHQSFFFFLFLSFVSVMIYLLSYAPLFRHHDFSHFVELHRQIFMYQTSLNADHLYASQAWQWPLGLSPVYLHLTPDGQQIWNRPFYPSWYYSLFCLFVAIILVLRSFFSARHSPASQKLAFLLLAYGCFWLPWLFSPRIMFFYHYLPAVPLLCVIAGRVNDFFLQLIRNRTKVPHVISSK